MLGSRKRGDYTLTDLMADDRINNSWVAASSLSFYMRKGHTLAQRGNASFVKPCLMVANLSVRKRAQAGSVRLAGKMVEFMREVEAMALRFGYAGVFVECVYNTRLHPLLQRSGYRRTTSASEAPCFFKSASSIRNSVRNACSGIHELQRPSLRRFLKTPDIAKFWLHEQKENMIMLVSRTQIGTEPSLNRPRFTLIRLDRYKLDSGLPDHTVYWDEDEMLLVKLLQKLESRLVVEGFQELAIYPDVINAMIKTGYGRIHDIPTSHQADRRMRELGYDISSGEDDLPLYVKPLPIT